MMNGLKRNIIHRRFLGFIALDLICIYNIVYKYTYLNIGTGRRCKRESIHPANCTQTPKIRSLLKYVSISPT